MKPAPVRSNDGRILDSGRTRAWAESTLSNIEAFFLALAEMYNYICMRVHAPE